MSQVVPFTHQGQLENVLRNLFPGAKIQQNIRKEMGIVYPPTGLFLEVDLWLPELQLAFEFQDAHHYTTTWRSHVPLDQIQKKDTLKKEALQERGQTLVTIPCWWDGSSESLVATIRKERPDLLQDHPTTCPPIDTEPPDNFFPGNIIPTVGQLMLPSFIVSTQFEPSSWWLSEKYDGVRACWSPSSSELYSRFGTKIDVNNQFLTHFPTKVYLDGEIWLGRGTFEDTQKLIAKKNKEENEIHFDDYDSLWTHARFVAFDNADPKTKLIPFESRFSTLLSEVSSSHPSIIPTFMQLCANKKKLIKITTLVMEHGGEGSIIRKPRSVYENGRSDSLLKFKANRMDLEALVVSPVLDSSNTYKLQLAGGTTIEAPYEGDATLQAGQVVTLSFSTFSTSGKPTNAKILRVRNERDWKEIEAEAEVEEKQQIHPLSVKALHETTRRPHGFWTRDEGRNANIFLEKLMKKMNRDILVPESWYDISPDIIANEEGGTSILSHFGGSVARTVTSSLPHLNLNPKLFKGNYWSSEKNRKQFFDDFARKNEIDLSNPENWYNVSVKDVLNEKSASYVLRYYGGNVISALVTIFPILKRSKFPRKSRTVETATRNRIQTFKNTNVRKKQRLNNLHKRYKISRKSRKNRFVAMEKSKIFRGLANVKGMLMYIRSKINAR